MVVCTDCTISYQIKFSCGNILYMKSYFLNLNQLKFDCFFYEEKKVEAKKCESNFKSDDFSKKDSFNFDFVSRKEISAMVLKIENVSRSEFRVFHSLITGKGGCATVGFFHKFLKYNLKNFCISFYQCEFPLLLITALSKKVK